MSVLSSIKPPMWPLSPELTEAPELWQGWETFLPLREGSGDCFDVIKRRLISRQPGPNSALPTWTFGQHGLVLKCDSNGGEIGNADHDAEGIDYESDRISIPAGSDITVLFAGEITSIGGANGGLMRSNGDDDADGENFFIYENSQPRPWIRLNGKDVLKITSGSSFSIGAFTVQAWVVRSGKDAEFWTDGELKHSASHTEATPAHEYRYVGHQFGESDAILADYALFGVATRALSSTEIKLLAADPFAMLRPRSDL